MSAVNKPRLMKGVFVNPLPGTPRLFGLKLGQIKQNAVIKSAGWYNQNGERAGFGDLDLPDLERIAADIAPGDFFIALSREDANCFVHPLVPGKKTLPQSNIEHPGQKYILGKARYIVAGDHIYLVQKRNKEKNTDASRNNEQRSSGELMALLPVEATRHSVISTQQARALIKKVAPQKQE